jgi:hypothetical protein
MKRRFLEMPIEYNGTAVNGDQTHGIFTLPLEIRQILWELMLDNESPRIVELKHCDESPDECKITSPTPVPAVVNICYESREYIHRLCKKKYNLLYTGTPMIDAIYFNREKDPLLISPEAFSCHWSNPDGQPCESIFTQGVGIRQHTIQRLAVHWWGQPATYTHNGLSGPKLNWIWGFWNNRFRGLREITFVYRDKITFDMAGFIRSFELEGGYLSCGMQTKKDGLLNFPKTCRLAVLKDGKIEIISDSISKRKWRWT